MLSIDISHLEADISSVQVPKSTSIHQIEQKYIPLWRSRFPCLSTLQCSYISQCVHDSLVRHHRLALQRETESFLFDEEEGDDELRTQEKRERDSSGGGIFDARQGANYNEFLKLSCLTLSPQVLSTAARLYIHCVNTHHRNVLFPYEEQLDALRQKQESELSSLLNSTTMDYSSSNSRRRDDSPKHQRGGVKSLKDLEVEKEKGRKEEASTKVVETSQAAGGHSSMAKRENSDVHFVVESTLLSSVIERHRLQLQTLEATLYEAMQTSAEQMRKDFHSFIHVAGTDVLHLHMASVEPTEVGSSNQNSNNNCLIDFGFDTSSSTRLDVKTIRIVNPIRGFHRGARPKEPSLAPIVFDVSKLSSLQKCLSLCGMTDTNNSSFPSSTPSSVDESIITAKVEEHLRRLSLNRHGGILFIGAKDSFQSLMKQQHRLNLEFFFNNTNYSTAGGTNMKSDKAAQNPLYMGSGKIPVSRYRSTNAWGATVGLHFDPADVSSLLNHTDHNLPPQATSTSSTVDPMSIFTDVFQDSFHHFFALQVTMISIVLLDDGELVGQDLRRHTYRYTPVLKALTLAIARTQMEMGGTRTKPIPKLYPTVPFEQFQRENNIISTSDEGGRSPRGSPTISVIHRGAPLVPQTPHTNLNYNLGVSIRLFVPDRAFDIVPNTIFGHDAEVVYDSRTHHQDKFEVLSSPE